MEQYRRDDMTFEVIDKGPRDGTPVVLLHGFPQFNDSWVPVIDRLTAQGYRCVAPNQRGYSPGARPPRRRDYVADELVADVVALIDALEVEKVHLVGHDWGATVAWATAALAPERLATVTTLSVPHPAAFFGALATSRQFLASWYIYLFQLPKVPEWLLASRGGRGLTALIEGYAGQTPAAAQRDISRLIGSGSFTTALNWYRAIPLAKPKTIRTRTRVPTMHVWSDGDKALLEKASRNTGKYVDAEYRFEVVRGVTHWMPDQCPDTVADLLLDWFAGHPENGEDPRKPFVTKDFGGLAPSAGC
jgi:pimeloyl-ACP methyl ester carboxylesterase